MASVVHDAARVGPHGQAGERLVSHSPQSPGSVVATAAETSNDTVVAAVEQAAETQRSWWAAGAPARAVALGRMAQLLTRRRDEAVDLVVREVGKPLSEARAEVDRAVSITTYYAQQALSPVGESFPAGGRARLWTERRPHGVAGLITPWNFPVAIPLWKAAPALAAGNTVVLKPSPDAFATAAWLAELAAEALPEGLLQVLPGGAETGAAVVSTCDVISFTGSETVGRRVAADAAARGVPVQAEMGGQNAAIVLPDADAAVAAATIAGAAMGFAGQKCTATRRIVVVGPEGRQSEVREALVQAVASLGVGDPERPDVSVGPLITEAARDRVVDATSAVVALGGRVLVGGEALDRDGWYVAPVLVDGVPPDHALAQEELFGPFAVVLEVPDVDAALRTAEGVRFGLVTSVHGRDAGTLLDVVDGVQTGMVKVNAATTGVDFYAPFGGERDSSYGPREQGSGALDFYTSTRTVTFASHP
jgi:aldehyde dehydrogenase (NAD+)